MAVNDSDKKTRAISEQRVEKGKELGQFQEAQGQLLNVQAEQRNNLNEARVVSEMEQQNNQTLAQAAGMLAASGGGAAAGVVAAQPQLNPGTKAILSKYGMGGKPGTQTRTTHTTQQSQTPQKISITNNTTTTNNNNVQVSQPSIPMSAPVIPMRAAQQSGDINKFKVWISNTFARQNEAAAIREKEYRRREWSLTRSANKMIRKMGEIGKSIGERMNPKNFGNILGDQLKVVFGLMGLHWVSENVGTILKGIEGLVKFFTGGKIKELFSGKKLSKVETPGWLSGIKETLIGFLGGDKNETFFGALKGLFTELVDRLSGEMKLLFDSRARAIKQIKFPEIDLGKMDMAGIVTTVGAYIGDILGVAFGGPEALVKTKVNEITRKARLSSLEEHGDDFSHTQDATHILGGRSKENATDTSLGDAVMYDKQFRKNFKMAAVDYDVTGGLSNRDGSSVKQSQYLVNQMNNMLETGKVDVGQLASGLSALKKSAHRGDGTLVTEEFLDRLGIIFGITDVMRYIKASIKKTFVRYVVVPKTQAELMAENAGGWGTLAQSYATNRVLGQTIGGAGRYGIDVSSSFSNGNWVEGVFNVLLGGLGSGVAAGIKGASAGIRGWAHDDYTIKMVRVDDPRYPIDKFPTAQGKDGKPLVDENGNIYFILNGKAVDLIEDAVKKRTTEDFRLESDNMETLKHLDTIMMDYIGKNSHSVHAVSGLEMYQGSLNDIQYLIDSDKREKEQFREKFSGGRLDKSIAYASVGSTLELFDKSGIKYKIGENYEKYENKGVKKGKPITKAETKKNALYIMDRLVNDKDLDLTPPQAAGIVGNLMAESNLNPRAVNGNAQGIAQWLGDRKKFFKDGESATKAEYPGSAVTKVAKDSEGNVISTWKPLHKEIKDSTLEEQVEYLIHELKTTHKSAVQKLRDLGAYANTSDAADIGLHSFEFQNGSLEGVEEEFAKKGQKGHARINTRRLFGADALETWNSAKKEEKSTWSEKIRNAFTFKPAKEEKDERSQILGKFSPLFLAQEGAERRKEDYSNYAADYIKRDSEGNIESILNPLYDDRTLEEKIVSNLSLEEQAIYNLTKRYEGNEDKLLKALQQVGKIGNAKVFEDGLDEIKELGFNDEFDFITDYIKNRRYSEDDNYFDSDKDLERLVYLLGLKNPTENLSRKELIKRLNEYTTNFLKSGKTSNLLLHLDDKQARRIMELVRFGNPYKYEKGKDMNLSDFEDSSDSYRIFSTSKKLDSHLNLMRSLKQNTAEALEERAMYLDEQKKKDILNDLTKSLAEEIEEQTRIKDLENYLEKFYGKDEKGNQIDIKDEKGNYKLKPIEDIINKVNLEDLDKYNNRQLPIENLNLPDKNYTGRQNLYKVLNSYGGIEEVNKIMNNPDKIQEALKISKDIISAKKFDEIGLSGELRDLELKAATDKHYLDTIFGNHLGDSIDNDDEVNSVLINMENASNTLKDLSSLEKKEILNKILQYSKNGKGLLGLAQEGDENYKKIAKELMSSDFYKRVGIETQKVKDFEIKGDLSLPDSLSKIPTVDNLDLISDNALTKAEAVISKLSNSKYITLDNATLLSNTFSKTIDDMTDPVSTGKVVAKANLNIAEILGQMAHNEIITGYYTQLSTQALIAIAQERTGMGDNEFNLTINQQPATVSTTIDPSTPSR